MFVLSKNKHLFLGQMPMIVKSFAFTSNSTSITMGNQGNVGLTPPKYIPFLPDLPSLLPQQNYSSWINNNLYFEIDSLLFRYVQMFAKDRRDFFTFFLLQVFFIAYISYPSFVTTAYQMGVQSGFFKQVLCMIGIVKLLNHCKN